MSALALKRSRVEHSETRAQARTRELKCESCAKPITHRTGRRPRYCSDWCRMREFGKGRSRKAFLGGESRAPTKRPIIDSKNNALERAKNQSSARILGPASVLAAEVFGTGRNWRSQTSSDGVAIEIAQRRTRALINPRRFMNARLIRLPRPRIERERDGDAW